MNTRENNFLVPYISANRNYWLVRTEGGTYYDSFHLNGYIGVSWNELDYNFFNQEKYTGENPTVSKEDLTAFYEQKYFNDEEKMQYYLKNSKRISTMVNRFVFEMKKGDIVLIPSASSETIAFGEIMDDHVFFENNLPETPPQEKYDYAYCPFVKRRSVRWLKDVRKDQLDSNLYTLLYSQHTINHIDDEKYGHYIDRTLDSIYIKGDKAHLVLNVQQTGDINALSFADIITGSVKIINGFRQEYPDVGNIDGKKIKIKANVQSPGPMELFGSITEVLLLTSIVVDVFGVPINKFKIIGFWKKEKSDELKDAAKLLESKEFKEYKKKVLPQHSTINELRENLEELNVESPTQDVNSTQNVENHEGIVEYETTE
ncbi:hypothetical protein ACFC4S_34370 [Priestia megaterium]|uniref:hypothetical protein n=1 Tax=Priestia megaterium TaxID=1404 RepID=UPI0035DA1FD2